MHACAPPGAAARCGKARKRQRGTAACTGALYASTPLRPFYAGVGPGGGGGGASIHAWAGEAAASVAAKRFSRVHLLEGACARSQSHTISQRPAMQQQAAITSCRASTTLPWHSAAELGGWGVCKRIGRVRVARRGRRAWRREAAAEEEAALATMQPAQRIAVAAGFRDFADSLK